AVQVCRLALAIRFSVRWYRIASERDFCRKLSLFVVAYPILRARLRALGDVERDEEQCAQQPEPGSSFANGLGGSAISTECEAEKSGERAEEWNGDESDAGGRCSGLQDRP